MLQLNATEAFGQQGWLRDENGNTVQQVTPGIHKIPNTMALYTSQKTFWEEYLQNIGNLTYVPNIFRLQIHPVLNGIFTQKGFHIVALIEAADRQGLIDLWQEEGIYGFAFGGHGATDGLAPGGNANNVAPDEVAPPYKLAFIGVYGCYTADPIVVGMGPGSFVNGQWVQNPIYARWTDHLSAAGSFVGFQGNVRFVNMSARKVEINMPFDP